MFHKVLEYWRDNHGARFIRNVCLSKPPSLQPALKLAWQSCGGYTAYQCYGELVFRRGAQLSSNPVVKECGSGRGSMPAGGSNRANRRGARYSLPQMRTDLMGRRNMST